MYSRQSLRQPYQAQEEPEVPQIYHFEHPQGLEHLKASFLQNYQAAYIQEEAQRDFHTDMLCPILIYTLTPDLKAAAGT